MDKYLGIVKAALEEDIIPRCHFEDITRADFYGFVLPFAEQLMKLGVEAGKPIKVRACDTTSHPLATIPLARMLADKVRAQGWLDDGIR